MNGYGPYWSIHNWTIEREPETKSAACALRDELFQLRKLVSNLERRLGKFEIDLQGHLDDETV